MPSPVPLTGLSILLVEDEATVARALARLLSLDAHRVTIALDGYAALAHLASESYDAILCDIRMPGLDGIGLHAEFVRTRPDALARLAFVTAESWHPDIREFLQRAGRPWIEKPAALEDLRWIVQRVVTGA